MNRLLTIISGIALLLYLFLVPYCYECDCVKDPNKAMFGFLSGVGTSSNSSGSSAFLLEDGDFKITAPEGATYGLSGNDLKIPADMEGAMDKLAAHLKQHPDKLTMLTGYYKKEETNNTTHPNLGIARAEAMKSALVAKGVNGSQLVTEGKESKNIAEKDGRLYALGMRFASATKADFPLKIEDGSKFNASAADNLEFTKSNGEATKPIAAGATKALQQLADYLKANPNRAVTLTGIYGEQEKNNTLSKTLGFARAGYVKNHLQKLGVPATQILEKDQKEPLLIFNNNVMKGGIIYDFEGIEGAETASKPADDAAMKALGERLRAAPRNVYFQTNSDNIAIDADLRQYLADLKSYMEAVPTTEVSVTGHTDSDGAANANVNLARRRAQFVLGKMTITGINEKQLLVDSKGEAQPIVANDSPENKAKNRRVEIRLK